MRYQIAILCTLITSTTVVAQVQPATDSSIIDASDKAAIDAAMEKDVIVEGVIDEARWSRSGKVMNIEFKNTEKSRLLAVIFERRREQMDQAFAGDVAKALTGAKVRIKGTLKPYGGRSEEWKGRPQIIIDYVQQITIVEPAATQPSTKPSGE